MWDNGLQGIVRMLSKKDIELAKSENDMDGIKWAWKCTNMKVLQTRKSILTKKNIKQQNCIWVAYTARATNDMLTKRIVFVDGKIYKKRQPQ